MVYIIKNKSQEIDGSGKFLGHQFIKNKRLYGDKRCEICGQWITWRDVEPRFCFEASVTSRQTGVSQCKDWQIRRETVLAEKAEIEEQRMNNLSLKMFFHLKKRGLVS